MKNCLFTTYKGSVDNENLPVFSVFDVSANATSTVTAFFNNGIKASESFYRKDSETITVNDTTGVATLPSGVSYIKNKYNLIEFGISRTSFNLDDLQFSPLTKLTIGKDTTYTSRIANFSTLSDLLKFSGLRNLAVNGRSITSEISVLSALTQLKVISLQENSGFTGDFASLAFMIEPTSINIFDSRNITGTVESFVKAKVSQGYTSGSLTLNTLYSGVTFNGDVKANSTLSWEAGSTAGTTNITFNGVTITIDNTTGETV